MDSLVLINQFVQVWLGGTIDAMDDETLPCTDKLAFDSEKEALDQARVIKWRHDTDLKAYKCRYCQLWHLSSNP